MQDLASIERAALVLLPESDVADALSLLNSINNAKQRLREVQAIVEERLIEFITVNGEIECGGLRHYVGTETTKKCRDIPETVGCILDESGGAEEVLASCLCAQPWKPATVLEVIGQENFDKLFVVEKKLDLRTGQPRKRLLTRDPKFIKQQSQTPG